MKGGPGGRKEIRTTERSKGEGKNVRTHMSVKGGIKVGK